MEYIKSCKKVSSKIKYSLESRVMFKVSAIVATKFSKLSSKFQLLMHKEFVPNYNKRACYMPICNLLIWL